MSGAGFDIQGPLAIVPSTHANVIEIKAGGSISGTTETTITTHTSTSNDERIVQISATGDVWGLYKVKVNGNTILEIRSNPMTANNIDFIFKEPKKLLDTEVLTVTFQAERILYGSGSVFVYVGGFIEN